VVGWLTKTPSAQSVIDQFLSRAQNCGLGEFMTRSELIDGLAEDNPHLKIGDIERIVAAFFDEMTSALVRGERVELRGFGAFAVKYRKAWVGRNPRTGETVEVAQKIVPFFRAGKELRARINKPIPSPGAGRSARQDRIIAGPRHESAEA